MLPTFRLCFFTLGAIAIAAHDIRTYRIPDSYLAVMLSALVLYDVAFSWPSIAFHIAGFLTGCLFLFLIYMLTKQGLGFGDVKYSAVIGYFLGVFWWAGALFLACTCGILYFICARMMKNRDLHSKIPFAPFLSFGAIAMGIIGLFV